MCWNCFIVAELPTARGITACFWNDIPTNRLYPVTYFTSRKAPACVVISRFEMEEDFASGVHTWPGLDDRFNKTLTGLYSFYIQVTAAANYTLRVNATGSMAVYVDNNVKPLIFFDKNSWLRSEQGTVLLEPGTHLFLLQYSSDKYTKQQISAEMMIGESFWRLLDASQTFQAGQGPSWLYYDVLSTKVDMPLVVKRPDYCGSAVVSFSVSPSLPTSLQLDPKTGVISGVIQVGADARTHAEHHQRNLHRDGEQRDGNRVSADQDPGGHRAAAGTDRHLLPDQPEPLFGPLHPRPGPEPRLPARRGQSGPSAAAGVVIERGAES